MASSYTSGARSTSELTEVRQGLTGKDLEGMIGTRTRIAEVLARKRGLSIAMIRRLHERLGISAEVLIRPSRGDAA
jgi:HTH-type transcriptional regulator/antitoxin HigA